MPELVQEFVLKILSMAFPVLYAIQTGTYVPAALGISKGE